jgi:hypothetical protein
MSRYIGYTKINKVLILPQSIAMSAKECQAVRNFVDRGGTVVADCRTAPTFYEKTVAVKTESSQPGS